MRTKLRVAAVLSSALALAASAGSSARRQSGPECAPTQEVRNGRCVDADGVAGGTPATMAAYNAAYVPPDAAPEPDAAEPVDLSFLQEQKKQPEPTPNPDVFFEDGIQVFIVDEPRWCSYSGPARDGCWTTAAACKKAATGCRRTTAWACFDFTARTSGETQEVCVATYEACAVLREALSNNPELTKFTGCTIMRLRTKGT